jgi:hypothetical protein
MAAWTVRNFWDLSSIGQYRHFVAARARRFASHGTRLTCEDLALRLVIEFAAAHELPLRLRNGTSANGFATGRPEFRSASDYEARVLSSLGARDLLLPGNTREIGNAQRDEPGAFRRAAPGDIVFLDYVNYGHIQVITEVLGNRVGIAQGNLQSYSLLCGMTGSADDPTSSCYAGAPVAALGYEFRDGYWRYDRAGSERVLYEHQGRILQWDFTAFNGAPPPAGRSTMRGPGAMPQAAGSRR